MTGKSFILNQLAGGSSDGGFAVGSSVQACTKGIWLWGAPLKQNKSPSSSGVDHLLLLDTEGLQSISATEGHDAKIFCLAILLSSFFIYNADKQINSAALDQLSLVAQLTQRIRVHADAAASANSASASSASSLASFFPRFVWLLRDFQLELTAADGHTPLSPTEYLEECLKPQPGASAAVREQNETREALRALFSQRECVALPHPTIGTTLPPSALKALPSLSKLAPGFQQGVNALKSMVTTAVPPKRLHGTSLTGPMLLALADSYVSAINDGALPTISTAWQSVITLESHRALSEATEVYTSGAARLTPSANTAESAIMEEAAWLSEHARLREAAIARFHQITVGDDGNTGGGFLEKLDAAIEAERARVSELLAARSTTLCERLVSSLTDRLNAYMAKQSSNGKSGPPQHAETLRSSSANCSMSTRARRWEPARRMAARPSSSGSFPRCVRRLLLWRETRRRRGRTRRMRASALTRSRAISTEAARISRRRAVSSPRHASRRHRRHRPPRRRRRRRRRVTAR